jgi:hypothetical protein
VPLANVPDLVWKMPSGTGSRGKRGHNPEAPNHFADMDQVPPDGSPDLLALCKASDDNVEPEIWIKYANKFPPKPGNKTGADGMGLLPFRVWQLYDAMVAALDKGSKDEFLCAAGTLAHYVGDSCQPLHISYLHHGDPDHPVMRIVKHTRGKKAGTSDPVNDSANVHEDYEQTMFRNDTGETVKKKLQEKMKGSPRPKLVESGKETAVATGALMQSTFDEIHPRDIVDAYDEALRNNEAKADILSMLWETFGTKTVLVMAGGCKLLACLWESAWEQGHGDSQLKDIEASAQDDLVALYDRRNFLTSYTLPEIDAHLKR